MDRLHVGGVDELPEVGAELWWFMARLLERLHGPELRETGLGVLVSWSWSDRCCNL